MQKFTGDATKLNFIDNNTIDCVVTSPPYGCGIRYDGYEDISSSSGDYYSMAFRSAAEMFRVCKDGARVWVNTMPSVPYENEFGERVPLTQLWMTALAAAGFYYRDTVVWTQDSYDGACAWGSWERPTAPNLRGGYEHILCFFKTRWPRVAPIVYQGWQESKHVYKNLGELDPLTSWQDLCRNTWKMKTASRKVGPASFPLELPARCIRLSTWPGDTVLDPFAGRGTTGRAADLLDREGVCIDIAFKELFV